MYHIVPSKCTCSYKPKRRIFHCLLTMWTSDFQSIEWCKFIMNFWFLVKPMKHFHYEYGFSMWMNEKQYEPWSAGFIRSQLIYTVFKRIQANFVCLVCGLMSHSTAMVISRRSVYLIILFLGKRRQSGWPIPHAHTFVKCGYKVIWTSAFIRMNRVIQRTCKNHSKEVREVNSKETTKITTVNASINTLVQKFILHCSPL